MVCNQIKEKIKTNIIKVLRNLAANLRMKVKVVLTARNISRPGVDVWPIRELDLHLRSIRGRFLVLIVDVNIWQVEDSATSIAACAVIVRSVCARTSDASCVYIVSSSFIRRQRIHLSIHQLIAISS